MKRGNPGLCILVCLWLLLSPTTVFGQGKIVVGPDQGAEAIVEALKKATPGTEILVLKGQYYGGFKLSGVHGKASAPIVLRAEKGVVWSIEPGVLKKLPSIRGSILELEKSSFVKISGFEFIGGERAITLGGCHHIKISENYIHDIGNYGLMSYYCDDVVFEKNIIARSFKEHGIYISGNAINVTVSDNVIENTRINGLHINGNILNALVQRNIFYKTGSFPTKEGGAAITFTGGARQGVLRNNLFVDIYGQGVTVNGSELKIQNNVFDGVAWSVVLGLPAALNMTFTGNLVREKDTVPFQIDAGVIDSFQSNYNYFDLGGQVLCKDRNAKNGYSFGQWQMSGFDKSSFEGKLPVVVGRPDGARIDGYRLKSRSPAIDAGSPEQKDDSRPPGMGGERADMGIFGGMGNAWGAD